MSFVFALLLAILHANEANASKKDAMPDAIAALTRLVKKAKSETPENPALGNLVKKAKPENNKEKNKRKPNLANQNRNMAASATAGKKSPPRSPSNNERKPRPPRGKLSPQQIKEIDRQKAAHRRQAQRRKVEQKKRDMERRDRKEEVLVRKQLQRIVKESKDNGCVNGKKSDKCESLRKKFDLNNDGDMTKAEIESKLKNTLMEMRNFRKHPNRPPPRRTAGARPNRPNRNDRPRSPSRKELEKRLRSPNRQETKGRPTPPMRAPMGMSPNKSELQKFFDLKKQERNANRNGNRNANRNANRYANRNAGEPGINRGDVRKADRNDGDRNDEDRRRPSEGEREAFLESLEKKRQQNKADRNDGDRNDEDRRRPSEDEREAFLESLAKRRQQNIGKPFDRNADDGDRIPFDPRREELSEREFPRRPNRNDNDGDMEVPRNNRNKAKK